MKEKVINFWSEFGVYIATVLGILFSRYLPEIISMGDISKVVLSIPSLSELILAFIIAVLVTHEMEREGDKTGKVKRIKRRLFNSFANGVLWLYLMQMFIKGD